MRGGNKRAPSKYPYAYKRGLGKAARVIFGKFTLNPCILGGYIHLTYIVR